MTGAEIAGLIASVLVPFTLILIALINRVADRSEWRGEVNADRKAFREFMPRAVRFFESTDRRFERADRRFERIERKIEEILGMVGGRLTATASSPIRLTALGKEISNAIQAKEWAEELAQRLTNEAAGKSAYEIQDLASRYCAEDLEITNARKISCEAAAFEHGVNLVQVKGVLGIELRDILLARAGLAVPE